MPMTLTHRIRSAGAAVAAVLALGVPGVSAQDSPQSLPTITLMAGMHRITAEVARTPEQRSMGLMHRKELPLHQGMLFVFDQPGIQCFWMKNTLLPLSIAFINDAGVVMNVAEMKPQSLNSHCATEAVRYALEMNAGWFAKRGIRAGDRLSGGPFLR